MIDRGEAGQRLRLDVEVRGHQIEAERRDGAQQGGQRVPGGQRQKRKDQRAGALSRFIGFFCHEAVPKGSVLTTRVIASGGQCQPARKLVQSCRSGKTNSRNPSIHGMGGIRSARKKADRGLFRVALTQSGNSASFSTTASAGRRKNPGSGQVQGTGAWAQLGRARRAWKTQGR